MQPGTPTTRCCSPRAERLRRVPPVAPGSWRRHANSGAPRAQAFYRKHGFVADGTMQVEDGVRGIRMVRISGDRAD
nr:GNAT family N-acetyltransferase [Agromyces sp. H66]